MGVKRIFVDILLTEVNFCDKIKGFQPWRALSRAALRLRVGLLHIYNVVVRNGLCEYFVRLWGTPRLCLNGFGGAAAPFPASAGSKGAEFFKEGEFIGSMLSS